MRSNNIISLNRGRTAINPSLRRRRTINEIEKDLVRHDLERAVLLSNIYDEAALLHYEDPQGASRSVEGLVQAATEHYAILSGGTSIPIKRITKVIT